MALNEQRSRAKNMRLQPPKTKKRTFNFKEFKEYVFSHEMMGSEQPLTALQLWRELVSKESFDDAMEKFITLWPYEHWIPVRAAFTSVWIDDFLKEIDRETRPCTS